MNAEGLIHLYYGDGKGKTTAAVGLAVRAAGAGKRVLLVQFLKGQQTGELAVLAQLPQVHVLRGKAGAHFTRQMDERELQQTYDLQTKNLLTAVETARAGGCDLLILDEALGALATDTVDADLLRGLVTQKPPQLELVLTGRNPPGWLLDAADYASEICKRKHPYDKGVAAREGIEF